MLCALRQSNRTRVIASLSLRDAGPFACPSCRSEVVLRSGTLRTPHFAHRTPDFCLYGKGESEEHRRCKKEIYEALLMHPDVTDLMLERHLGEVRPDVSAIIRGVKVAIEVQISALPLETVIRRTEEYARRGIALLWLSPWTPKLDRDRYAPRAWERWFHDAYGGRVFYWKSGLTILPYRFEPYRIYVPKMEWKDKKGRWTSGGGYERRSKRFRRAVADTPIHLARDSMPLFFV